MSAIQDEFIASVQTELENSKELFPETQEFLQLLVNVYFGRSPEEASDASQCLMDFMNELEEDSGPIEDADAVVVSTPKKPDVFEDEARMAAPGDFVMLDHGIFDTVVGVIPSAKDRTVRLTFANSKPQDFPFDQTLVFQEALP